MPTRSRIAARFAGIVLLLTFAVLPAAAQEFGPGILPADTSFFVYSHGTAHAETAAASNPMVQSWNSPEFAQFRQQGIAYLLRHSDWKSNGRPVNFGAAEIDQIFSFLKSPMMFGYAGSLDFASLAKANTPSAKQLMDAGGMFLIIDVSGKTAPFDLLFKLIEVNVPKEVTRTRSDSGGVSIEKFAGPNNTSFAARVGNYFVWSSQEKVTHDLVARLGGHGAAGNSLAQDSTFQRTRGNLDPDVISEVYFHVPDFTKLPIPASEQFDTPTAMRSLHLDAMRAFYGSYAITQQGEHSKGILLGDTTAGGIFDLFGTNRSHFDTLALAPASAYSYMAYSFDLNALYKLVNTVIVAGMPQQQAAMIQMAEGMASAQIGMSVTDAIALVGGEFATIQLDPKASTPVPLIALSITNPEKVALLFHKLGGDSMVEDSHEGAVTYFKSKTAAPAADSTDPLPTTSYAAITPHFLLYGTDKQVLKKAAQSDTASGGSSIANGAEISGLRAALPQNLLGLSITDYSHHDWAGDITKALGETETASKSKLSPEDIQFFETVKKFSATTIGKVMLRRSVGGWWKEADGIHYEGFSQ